MTHMWRGYHAIAGKSPGYLAKRFRKHGSTLPAVPLTCRLIIYNSSELSDRVEPIEECAKKLKDLTTSVGWLHISGNLEPAFVGKVGELFDLHPLVQEDILNPVQRPKLDDYEKYIYIVTRLLTIDPKTQELCDEQVSIILTANYVISFVEHDPKAFDPIIARLQAASGRLRRSKTDYLCYALLDLLVDQYYIVLEQVDERLEALEEELLNRASRSSIWKIQSIRKEVTLLRKAVWPMREVVSQYMRLDNPIIQHSTIFYIHDAYDHTVQAIDAIETFRDLISGMLDIYLSTISQKLNEVMKVLTVVSTTFVPLTFIASLYGMNFDNIPGLHSQIGFIVCVIMMLSVALGMLYFFRTKKWI